MKADFVNYGEIATLEKIIRRVEDASSRLLSGSSSLVSIISSKL